MKKTCFVISLLFLITESNLSFSLQQNSFITIKNKFLNEEYTQQIAHYTALNKNFSSPPINNGALFCHANHCLAIGTDAKGFLTSFRSNDAGSHWTAVSMHSPPMGQINKILCDYNTIQCAAIGYSVDSATTRTRLLGFSTNDGGNTWTESQFSIPTNYDNSSLSLLACDDAINYCVTVGNMTQNNFNDYIPASFFTTDTGRHWTASTLSPPAMAESNVNRGYFLDQLTCSHFVMNCLVRGENYTGTVSPLRYKTADGGDTWSMSPLA
ncbi:MAG: hypothetical protein JO131_04505 [Gammaproteobacteria bacterium]|nr:hypothetical protein [Gammaproteobacteria bacterium]